MVVSVVSPGQLGNKLFQYAYFLGNAMEFNGEVATLDFDAYRQHFNFSLANKHAAYPRGIDRALIDPRIVKAFWKLSRLAGPVRIGSVSFLDIRRTFDNRKEHFQISSEEFRKLARSTTLYVAGYYFRDIPNLFKHRESIIEFLSPVERHRLAVAQHLEPVRNRYLVGIHIRHGDYANYLGGKYFYSLDQYKDLMAQIAQQAGKPTHFLVASNANFSAQDFAPFDVTLAPGDMVQDLYCLAECDLIVGPPSTYSLWASFQHLKPLIHVYDPKLDLDVAGARPIYECNAP